LDRGSLQALLFLKGGVIMGLKFVWEPISDNEGGYSLSSFIDESEYLFIAPLWSILEFFQLMRESEGLTKKGFDKYFQHNTMAMRGLLTNWKNYSSAFLKAKEEYEGKDPAKSPETAT
jgi:hypothetical protein